MAAAAKVARADIVLDNDGPREALERQLGGLLRAIERHA